MGDLGLIPGLGRSSGEGNGHLVLPGQFHGQRSLAGYSAPCTWSRKESDTTERLALIWLKPEHWFNNENNGEEMILLRGHSDYFSFGQSCPRYYFLRECFMKTIGFLNPMPSLFLDLFSHLFQPHSSMSNAITLDLDITNKYTTAKMSWCQALTFFTCILPLSPYSVPAIIQLSGEKWSVFQSHHLTSPFLTSPSLDSMDKYYNQFACNSFVPLSHLIIPQLWLNSTAHFLCPFALKAECSWRKSTSIIDWSFSKFMSNNYRRALTSA